MTEDERKWVVDNCAVGAVATRKSTRSGGFAVLVGSAVYYEPAYIAEVLVVPGNPEMTTATCVDRFIAYLIANFQIVRNQRPNWSVTAQATYTLYATTLSFRIATEEVTAMKRHFAERAPGEWDQALTDTCQALNIPVEGLNGKALLIQDKLPEEVTDAARKLVQIILNHGVLVTTHVGTTTNARITKFNAALTASGYLATPPRLRTYAWAYSGLTRLGLLSSPLDGRTP